ncbi:unnamed protein product, partial [Amoebophrya sp. A25]
SSASGAPGSAIDQRRKAHARSTHTQFSAVPPEVTDNVANSHKLQIFSASFRSLHPRNLVLPSWYSL